MGFCNCFVVRYFVAILVLQSSRWVRESWLLCFVCLPGVHDCCVALPLNVTGLLDIAFNILVHLTWKLNGCIMLETLNAICAVASFVEPAELPINFYKYNLQN